MLLTFTQRRGADTSKNKNWIEKFCEKMEDKIAQKEEHWTKYGIHYHVLLKSGTKTFTIPPGWDGMVKVNFLG